MTSDLIEITEDEFDATYPLISNHLRPDAGWVYGETGGCLFETYGEELAFVRRQDPCTVWTLVDGDDGDQYLLSGFHRRKPRRLPDQHRARSGRGGYPGAYPHARRCISRIPVSRRWP